MYLRRLLGLLIGGHLLAQPLSRAAENGLSHLLPSSADFLTYATAAEAEAAGWRGNYGSRLGVVRHEDGDALEARGATHHGGMHWFPRGLDLSGAQRMCYRVKQNVHSTYRFTWVLQFEGGLENVVRVAPGGAGWRGWRQVELDLSTAKLGKLRKIGIYSNGFRDTESKFLQLDGLHFVMPGPGSADARPVLTAPRLLVPPAVDGVVDGDEWARAAGTVGFVTLGKGHLSERQTRVYVGYDDDNLYVAYVSEYAAVGDFDRGRKGRITYNDLGENQDFVELWLQPNSQTYRQLMVNMNGGVFERDVIARKETDSGAKAASSLAVGEYLAGGTWSAELIIPFEGLGVSSPGDGEAWRVLFCRDYRSGGGSRSGADWTSSVFTKGDFNKPHLYGALRFSSGAPTARLGSVGRMSEGQVLLSGDVLADRAGEARVAVRVAGHDTGPLLQREFRQPLTPGINQFELRETIRSAARTEAVCQLTIRCDGSDAPIYRNRFSFLLGTPLRVTCVSRARRDALSVDVDARQVKGLAAENRVRITLRRDGQKAAALTDTFPYPRDAKNVLHEVDCSGLERGRYRVEVVIVSSAGTVLARSTEPAVWVGAAGWANNTIGISDEVPPPWKPIEANGRQIGIAGRLYTIGDSGLPAAVTAIGKELLARPAELVVHTERGRERCDFRELRQLAASSCEVVLGIEGECSSFRVKGSVTVEYDGFALWEIELTPKRPVEAADVAVLFELPSERSLYARGKTIDSTASGYAAVLAGVGEPAELAGAGQTKFCANGWPWDDRFFYEVFVGDDDSGIALLTESAKRHRGERHVAIEAAGPNRTLRLQLTSNHEVTPQTPLRYEYAWVALPLRPRPTSPDAWHVTIGPTGKVDARVDEVDPELFSRCPVVIAGRLLRYDSHYQVIDPDPAKRVRRRAGHQWPDVIGEFVKRANHMGSKVVTDGVYWADADTSSPEAQRYLEEWKLAGSGVTYWNYQNALDVGACARSSWLDFQAYAAKRILENGINGVYLDVSAQSPCRNHHHGCGYVDHTGLVRKTVNLWAIRELHKRVYTYYKSQKPAGAMVHHHLDSAAWAGFCDGGFQGEQLASERSNPRGREYQNVTPELFRAMAMNQYGTPYTWYALFSYYGRTPMSELMAMCLPHNVMPAIWNVRHNQWQDIKPYWDVLDDWWSSSEFVGYWHPRPPARVAERGVLASAFVKRRAALLVVANWNYSPLADVGIEIDRSVLGAHPGRLSLTNALTGGKLTVSDDGRLAVALGARDVRLVSVTSP